MPPVGFVLADYNTDLRSVFSRGWLFEKERVVTKRDVPFDKATSALAEKSFLVTANLNS